jgi:putative transposase
MKMIKRNDKLSIVKQCNALKIWRSGVYYEPKLESEENLEIMRLMDKIQTDMPYYGTRRMPDELREHGFQVNRKRAQRLMRLMGIGAIYPKPNLSKKNKKHKIYPYLLRGLKIERPNQVWATDITYIPMDKGFVFLVAVMDLYSRKILSWRLSNTLDVGFCVDTLEEALYKYGKPEIFNTDQGSQFTSESFTEVLKKHNIKISMDGKGAWRDNVFVERFWRSIKYEEIYLKAYDSMREAKQGIGDWMKLYNTRRVNQTTKKTPDEKYGIVQSKVPKRKTVKTRQSPYQQSWAL